MMQRKALPLALLLALGLAGLNTTAQAQLDFHVNLNTNSITGGTYNLDFELSDGNAASTGTPDGTNEADITNFNLGGGTAGAILPPTTGSASGTISTGFTLKDNVDVSEIAQGFTAGNFLSFDVHLNTTALDSGGTPDNFLFRILDSAGTTFLVTSDPKGTGMNNGFIDLDLNSSTLTVSDVANSSYGSSSPTIPAPTITSVTPASVPEPGVLALLAAGGVGGLLALRRKGRMIAR